MRSYSTASISNKKKKKAEQVTLIDSKIESKSDFKKYKQEQFDLAKKIKEKDDVRIVFTFNEPLSEKELEKLVKKYNINVISYEIKATNAEDEWITVGGVPEEDELFSEEKFKEVTLNLDAKFKGFTSLEGTVDDFKESDYKKIADDSQIFLADLSKQIAFEIHGTDAKVILHDYAQQVSTLK